MKNIVLIDGLGDMSLIKELKPNIPNNSLLLLGQNLRNMDFNVIYMERRQKNFSIETLSTIKQSQIIIYATFYNYKRAAKLSSYNNSSENIVYYFADNIVVKKLLLIENISEKYIIYLDSTKSYEENFNFILKNHFKYEENFTFKYDYQFWDSLEHNIMYSYQIILGKLFPEYSVKTSIEEMKHLLEIGVKHIHIKTYDKDSDNANLISHLCEAIKSNFSEEDDFTMSCTLKIEDVINNPDLFKQIKDCHKIERVELEVNPYSEKSIAGNNYMLLFPKINEMLVDIKKYDFTSIVVDYTIGGPGRTKEILTEIKNNSLKMVEILPGIVEFSLTYFYDDNLNLQDDKQISLIQKGFLHTYNSYLSIDELNHFKSEFYSELTLKYKNHLKDMSLLCRKKHTVLASHGLLSIYYYMFLSKSTIEALRNLKIRNKNWKNSWEIEDNIFDYTPTILMKLYFFNKKRVLFFDHLMTGIDKNYIELSDFDYFLYKQARGLKSLQEIYESAMKEFDNYDTKKVKEDILNFFSKLEKYDLVLYVKLLY